MPKNEYPKWLYHAVKEAKLVQSEAEHGALCAEWVESPALAKAECAPVEVSLEEAPQDAPKRRGRKPKVLE